MFEQLKAAWFTLQKEQQISVVLLGVLGVIAFGLSAYRVRANIFEPFLVSNTTLIESKKLIGDTPEQMEARSKRIDTDGDGISDWAETNIYRTNPNLRDSCGDGIPDNVRIATNKNINCGKAPDYNTALSGDAQASGTTKVSDLNLAGFADYPDAPPQNTDTAQAFQVSVPRDPATLRELLKDKIPADKLKLIPDDELLKLYDQAIAIQSGQNPDAVIPESTPSSTKPVKN